MNIILAIINHNSSSMLRKNLVELLAHLSDIQDHNIILQIIDNSNSTRELVNLRDLGDEIMSQFQVQYRLRVIDNYGFGAACNNVMNDPRLSPEDYLIFLNPDIYPASNYRLNDLVSSSASFNGAILLTPEGKVQSVGCRRNLFGWIRLSRDMRKARKSESWNVFALHGAFMGGLLRNWRSVGGFDEDYFMYLEETDFFLRAKHLGHSCAVHKNLRFYHTEGATSASHDVYKVILVNYFKFVTKNYSNVSWYYYFYLIGMLKILLYLFKTHDVAFVFKWRDYTKLDSKDVFLGGPNVKRYDA